jgi:hypothetical protein
MTANGTGQFCYTYTPTEVGRYDFKGVSDGCEKSFATYIDVNSNGASTTTQNSIMQTLYIPSIGAIISLLLISISFVVTSTMAAKSLRYAGIIFASLNLYISTLLGASTLLAILSAGLIAIGTGSLLDED